MADRRFVSPLQLYAGRQIPETTTSVMSPVAESRAKLDELYDAALAAGGFYGLGLGNVVKAVPAAIRHGATEFARANVPAHVVKPKGGNWLTGSVEDALSGLKRPHLSTYGLPIEQGVDGVGNPLRAEQIARMRQEGIRYMDPATGEIAGEAPIINSWIEGPLTKYVKTRMASPDDEVRRLAEQGVLHYEPRVEDAMRQEALAQAHRRQGGFSEHGVAANPLGRSWETLSDASINPVMARDLSSKERAASFGGKSDIPPDTTVHMAASPMTRSDNLGFNHLIDELSNALNPNSGLPPHLQLSPEAVKQLSMEKAVRRVADINAWRAAQKAEANQKFGLLPPLVRDYPHSDTMPNPKGLRWVELKASDPDPAMYTLREGRYTSGKPHYEYVDKNGEPVASAGGTPEEALQNLKATKGEAELQRQLKYEGDTMGHCVGGYCDDVLSGRSRIFSLRDAKGEPHVTVEVAPNLIDAGTYTGEGSLKGKMVTRDELLKIIDDLEKDPSRIEQHNRIVRDYSLKQTPFSLQNWRDAIADTGEGVPKIVQIKGKANRKPNNEYLPFVQDFVRNPHLGQPWSDVGDLGNTGLIHAEKAGVPKDLLKGPSPYLTKEEYDALVAENVKAAGFAHGGSVSLDTAPANPKPDIQAIIAAMKEYHANT